MLGHHQQTRGVFVETVHDPRSAFAADRQLWKPKQQGVGDRARVVAGAGMNDVPRGLFNHTDVVVVVDDRQRQILGDEGGVRRRRHRDRDRLATAQLEAAFFGNDAVDDDNAVVDELACARTRQPGLVAGDESIEAFAATSDRHHERDDANERWTLDRLLLHQIFDFTCPLDFKMMSTTARSKKFVRS